MEGIVLILHSTCNMKVASYRRQESISSRLAATRTAEIERPLAPAEVQQHNVFPFFPLISYQQDVEIYQPNVPTLIESKEMGV